MMNLHDFLANVASNDEPPPLPSREAQAEELRQIMASLTGETTRFKQGQIVRTKRRLGNLKPEIVLVFWGYIDYGDKFLDRRINDASPATIGSLPGIDCLVADVSQPILSFEPFWSPFLEVDTEAAQDFIVHAAVTAIMEETP